MCLLTNVSANAFRAACPAFSMRSVRSNQPVIGSRSGGVPDRTLPTGKGEAKTRANSISSGLSSALTGRMIPLAEARGWMNRCSPKRQRVEFIMRPRHYRTCRGSYFFFRSRGSQTRREPQSAVGSIRVNSNSIHRVRRQIYPMPQSSANQTTNNPPLSRSP